MIYSANDTAAAVRRGLASVRDRPSPDDASRSPAKYARMSRDFRAGAWKHLREDGDLPQASNKAWGMVAETVKAISAHHGGVIHTHRAIWSGGAGAEPSWSRQSGDADTESQWLSNAFQRRARPAFTNFYEDEASPARSCASGITPVRTALRNGFYELFWPEGVTASDRLNASDEE